MIQLRSSPLSISATAVLAWILVSSVPAANAQGVPGSDPNKCLAGKTKCVNKKIAGLFKCRTKCQQSPTRCGQPQTDCETKVIAKFDGGANPAQGCFAKLESREDPAKPESVCTTTGDTSAMEARADTFVDEIVMTLEGNPPPTCGDGVVNGDESCDGVDLNGADCVSLGFAAGMLACTAGCGYDVAGCTSNALPSTGQVTCWDDNGNVVGCAGTGHDGDTQAGAPLAYQDNGDGSLSDLNTGLTWEKKSDDGSRHDWDNCYPWFGICSGHGMTRCERDVQCASVGGTCDTPGSSCGTGSPNGVTLFEWLDALNAASFAGHSDWRIPSVRELESIVNYGTFSPAVSPAFNTGCTPGCTVTMCSCTQSLNYWTSTSRPNSPLFVWNVNFNFGFNGNTFRSDINPVRAVRGGP